MQTSHSDKQNQAQTFASEIPDMGALQTQFEACSPHTMGWSRLDDNDRTRYMIWDGQSADGKKWDAKRKNGDPAFPWNGASDARIPLADEVINETVDYLTEAFWRAVTRVQGNPETEHTGKAAYARKLIEWIRGTKLYGELVREIELHAQNGCTYGASFLQAGWKRELGYKLHTIKLADFVGNAERGTRNAEQPAPPSTLNPQPSTSPLTGFAASVMDPTNDDQSIEMARQLYAAYIEATKPTNYDWDPAPLSKSRARKVVKELRETGEADVPLPYLCKNEPFLRARKLWEDIFIPESTRDIQEAPAVFLLDWYTEAALRAEAKANDWDEAWVEEAVKKKGEFSQFTQTTSRMDPTLITTEFGYTKVDMSDLIEITTCLRKLVDDDGVMGVYVTIYQGAMIHDSSRSHAPHADYAFHGLSPDPVGLNYPLTQWRREVNMRSILASRGIPQIVATWQQALKVQEDSITDRTSFETIPPILVPSVMGVGVRFGPAVQVPLRRMDQRPEFMPGPQSNAAGAMEVMDRIERRTDRYFGKRRPDGVPEDGLIKKQKQSRTFLLSCSEAMQFLFQLMAVNTSPEELQEITGMTEPFADRDTIEAETAFLLTYDVQELSPDFVTAKFKALSEIAAEDPSGTIDQGKLALYKLRGVDPALVGEITNDAQGASQAIFKQVKADWADMLLGIPATPTKDDPTAEAQLKFAQQILQVSKVYQRALKEDPEFQRLVQEWEKNKMFSIEQQKNKQIGRYGVDPAAGAAA